MLFFSVDNCSLTCVSVILNWNTESDCYIVLGQWRKLHITKVWLFHCLGTTKVWSFHCLVRTGVWLIVSLYWDNWSLIIVFGQLETDWVLFSPGITRVWVSVILSWDNWNLIENYFTPGTTVIWLSYILSWDNCSMSVILSWYNWNLIECYFIPGTTVIL